MIVVGAEDDGQVEAEERAMAKEEDEKKRGDYCRSVVDKLLASFEEELELRNQHGRSIPMSRAERELMELAVVQNLFKRLAGRGFVWRPFAKTDSDELAIAINVRIFSLLASKNPRVAGLLWLVVAKTGKMGKKLNPILFKEMEVLARELH